VTRAAGEYPLQVESPDGPVDALRLVPDAAVAQLVLAHGAGAGFLHANMQGIADAFAGVGLATLRFNFPFTQHGRRRVDRKEVSVATIAAAAECARNTSGLPLFLAGHSFGGRMCSHAAVDPGVECRGLIFCSFPLHQPKKPSIERAAHLPDVGKPMLFLSGTRDDLAHADLLEGVVAELKNARVHWLETANHSYVVLKRTRTHPLPVFEEIALATRSFVDEVI